MKHTAVIAIHGGAGTINKAAMSPEKEQQYRQALRDILASSQAILAAGGTAIDAVTEAVRLLEECPLFNAGTGSVFTSAGTHELDASIMDGKTLDAGAVASVSCIRNPILAARKVMEKSPHVLFSQTGAENFAKKQGLEIVPNQFFSTDVRYEQLQRALAQSPNHTFLDHSDVKKDEDPIDPDNKYGTVGAVALDASGNLAAATSTGGMTNKQPGRIGDSPIIGAGCYANNKTVAVSATGTGEMFIRAVAAYDVSALMEYKGLSLDEATQLVVMQKLVAIKGEGGLIAVDHQGNVALPFNSEGMYRGFAKVGQPIHVAIYKDE